MKSSLRGVISWGVLAEFDRVSSLTYSGNEQRLKTIFWDNYGRDYQIPKQPNVQMAR
jgi:hypothetical protein